MTEKKSDWIYAGTVIFIVIGVVFGLFWWDSLPVNIPADEDPAVAVREAEGCEELPDTYTSTFAGTTIRTDCDDPTISFALRVYYDPYPVTIMGSDDAVVYLSKDYNWRIDHDTSTEWIVITVGDTEPVTDGVFETGADSAITISGFSPVECEWKHYAICNRLHIDYTDAELHYIEAQQDNRCDITGCLVEHTLQVLGGSSTAGGDAQ